MGQTSPSTAPQGHAGGRIPHWGMLGGSVAIALTVFLLYRPALNGEFVWDDQFLLANNLHFRGLEFQHVWWAFSTAYYGPYQPLAWLSYGLDFLIWGMKPSGFHLTNIVLHALCSMAFGALALRIFSRAVPTNPRGLQILCALFAAAAFALHPLRVESVAWASARRDTLSGLFFALAVLAYVSAFDSHVQRSSSRRRYWVSVIMFALALLSKATVVGLPVVLLMLDWFPLRRTGVVQWKRLLSEKLPYFVLSIGFGIVAIVGQRHAGAMAEVQDLSAIERLAIAAYSFGFYPQAMTIHWQWFPLYERPELIRFWSVQFAGSAVAVFAISLAAIAFRRKGRGMTVAWFSYLVLLLPMSGLLQAGVHLVADRYSYVSTMPLVLIAASCLAFVGQRWPLKSWPMVAAVCVSLAYVIACVYFTSQQIGVWKNAHGLWTHVLKSGPSPMAHFNLGDHAWNLGEFDVANQHYAAALRIRPDFKAARARVVDSLVQNQSNHAASDLELEHALRSSLITHPQPPCPECWYALGRALMNRGEFALAREDLMRVLDTNPASGQTLIALGQIAAAENQPNEALRWYERATQASPRTADGWVYLIEAHLEGGDPNAAQMTLESFSRLFPTHPRIEELQRKIKELQG